MKRIPLFPFLFVLTALGVNLVACAPAVPAPTTTTTAAASSPIVEIPTFTPEPSPIPIDETIVTVTESQTITVGTEQKQVTIAHYKGQEVAVDPTAQTGGWYESVGGTWKAWDPEHAADDMAYEVKAALLLRASGKNIDVVGLFAQANTEAKKTALLTLERKAFANWYDLNRERAQYETRMPYAWRHAEIVYMPNYTTAGKWTDYNGRRIFLGINETQDVLTRFAFNTVFVANVSDGRVDVTLPGYILTSTDKAGSMGVLLFIDEKPEVAEEAILDYGTVDGERRFMLFRVQFQSGSFTDVDDGREVKANGKLSYQKTGEKIPLPITMISDGNHASVVVDRIMLLDYIKANPDAVPVIVWNSVFQGPYIVNGVSFAPLIMLGQ